ncbi:MAG: hypothetical protein K0S18_621 [Anaerocolumna sp.]|jgi:hypothetical protein|nr:hypothetical protein [Anaerocolumna sp.]
MKNKKIKVDFEMKFSDVVDLNKSFAKAKCLIAYTGRNRNYSDISKDVFLNALPSIKNIPIVARYDDEKDDFGGHDIRIVETENGISIANATVPFGVVPESANQWFEELILQNGEKKECLFTDVILWKRQYGYEHIVKAEKISQSMEINVSSYIVDSDGYYVVEKMEFEALTLLGENVEPCFENANLQLYSKDYLSEFKQQYSNMLQEFKLLNQSSTTEVEINNLSKGGTEMDDNKEIVIEETTKEVAETIIEEPVVETVEVEEVAIETLIESVETVTEETIENNITQEDIVEEATTDFSQELKDLQSQYDNLLKEFNEYKENYSTSKADVDELITYKNKKMEEERKANEDIIFDKFEERIGNTTEFSELKANSKNYTLAELEKECIYIVGLHTEYAKETKKQENLKFSVEKETDETKEVYGDLFKKYKKD